MQVANIIYDVDKFNEIIKVLTKYSSILIHKIVKISVSVDQRTYIQTDRNIHHKLSGRGGSSDKYQGEAKNILITRYQPKKMVKEIQ